MATVIDSLIVTLGLDGSRFRRGAAQAGEDIKRTKDEIQRRSAEIEAAGARASQYFAKLRNEVIALFAAFGASFGLQQFIRNTVNTEASIGRLAKTIGMSVEGLSAWQGAAERTGGSAEAIGSTFQSLSNDFQRLSLTGESSTSIQYLSQLGIAIRNVDTGKVRDIGDIMLDLADAVKSMPRQRANAMLMSMGIDQGTINLILEGRGAIQKLLEEQRKLGVITDEQAKSGIAFQNAMKDVIQTVQTLGRELFTALAPSIILVLNHMRDWMNANREWLKDEIIKRVMEIVASIKEFVGHLSQMIERIQEAGGKVDEIVQKMGGWVQVTEVLFGLWIGSKFLAVVASITKLLTLLRFVPGSGVTGAVLAALGIGALAEDLDKPKEGDYLGMRRLPGFGGTVSDQDQVAAEGFFSMLGRMLGFGGGGPRRSNQYMPTADLNMTPEKRAFLDALSMGESGGDYNAKNPTSSAHGRYQFINSTDAEVSAKTALPGQDPISQDKKGWYLAATTYQRNTGRDLEADIKGGGRDADIAYALRDVWPSLPGGSQQNTTMQAWLRQMTESRAKYAPGQPPPQAAPAPEPVKPLPKSDGRPLAYLPDPSMRAGAYLAARSVSNDNSRSNTTTVATNINGPIQIQTSATDSDGIARGIGRSLQRYNYVPQANSGLA